MPSSYRDPRTFVKPVPLPIPSHKGIKIQARSDKVYNPTEPNRDHVRKENYDRRLLQMSQQGFRSVNYKPYQGIGDPFYLDHKKLILHALGQWNEGDDDSSSFSSDNDRDDDNDMFLRKPKSPAKFILKRPRKDINTLNKEVNHGRNMIRNCRLGHGLFQMIRHERQAKSDRARQEIRKKREQAMNTWQAPKSDASSDDETDEEIADDVDISSYMGNGDTWNDDTARPSHPPSARSRSKVAFAGFNIPGPIQSKPATPRPGSRKKKKVPTATLR